MNKSSENLDFDDLDRSILKYVEIAVKSRYPQFFNRISEIKQDVLIRIWNKQSLYDSSKPLNPWVKTICGRYLSNLNRYQWKTDKTYFRNPEPIKQEFTYHSSYQGYEITYTPILIEANIKNEISEDFLNSNYLSEIERKYINYRYSGFTNKQIQNFMRFELPGQSCRDGRNPQRVYYLKEKIKNKYKLFLNDKLN